MKFEFEMTDSLHFSESSPVGAIPKCFDSQFQNRILLDQSNLMAYSAVGPEGVNFSSYLQIDGQINRACFCEYVLSQDSSIK